MLSHLAAGIVGALAVLFGAQHLPGVLPSGLLLAPTEVAGDPAELANLRSTVANLEQRLAGMSAPDGDGLATISGRLTAVEQLAGGLADLQSGQKSLAEQTAALAQRLDGAATATPAALPTDFTDRLAALEQALAKLGEAPAAASAPDVAPQLAALGGRINDFSVALDTRTEALRAEVGERLTAFEGRLSGEVTALRAAGEARLEAIETLKAGDRRLGLDIEAIKSGTEALTSRLDRVAAAQDEQSAGMRTVTEQVQRVETAVTAFSDTMEKTLAGFATDDKVQAAIAPLAIRVGQMAADVGRVVENESLRQQSSRQIVLALELADLRRALARGEPAGPILARVKEWAPADLDLSGLEGIASSGAPSPVELQRAFPDMARAALDAEQAASGDGSVVGQLWSGARSLVKVRRTGDIAGDGTEAVVARMETRLGAGDLAGALEEAAGLQGPAREAIASWLAQLESRVAVDKAMADIEARLKQRLAGAPAN
ncbi:MAG: hypothetical protein GC150_11170 [Rhizobiales bacterium]|nr:hypothetical protein [Hyphomicrobiales bacterium]